MAVCIDGESMPFESSVYVVCDACGVERRVNVTECRVCFLEGEVRRLSGECKRLNDLVFEVRRDASVRLKGEISAKRVEDRARTGNSVEVVSDDEWWVKMDRIDKLGQVRCVNERDIEPVRLTNRFNVLREEECESDLPGVIVDESRMGGSVTESRREGNVRPRQNRRMTEVLVMGDSQIRYLDRKLSDSKWKGMRVCLPGAGVSDVCERYDRLVSGCERDAVVITHVGVNDVKKVGTCELREQYKRLVERMSKSRVKGVVSGVLPRLDVGVEWLSRAIGLNEFVKGLCEELGLVFVDVWGGFYGNRRLYAMDGLHLSRAGVEVLWGELDSVIRSLRVGN